MKCLLAKSNEQLSTSQSQQYTVLWQGSGSYLIGNWIIARYKLPVTAEQISGYQVNLTLS